MSDILFIECKICHKQFKTYRALGIHIKCTHKIETKEYYDHYIKHENENLCIFCGNQTNFKDLAHGYHKFCSTKCVNNSEIIKQKIEKTNFEKYGTKSTIQNKDVLNKRNKNNLEKYGTEHPSTLETVKEKAKETLLNRYGVNNISKLESIKKKKEETCLKNFGVKHYTQSSELFKNYENTCLEKYGVKNISQLEEIKEKKKQTTFLHYGVENPNDSHEIQSLKCKKYFYDNNYFDSSWEIAYYIWLKNNGVYFEYQPKQTFEYTYNNKIFKYHPDFLVENYFVEIKGSHFFDTFGNFINPYNRNLDGQYKEKYKCMLDNNIIIIRNCDKYLNYVNKKFGKNYLKQFKKY